MSSKYNILQVGAALEEGGVERTIVEIDDHLTKQSWGSFIASAGGKLEAKLAKTSTHITLPLQKRNPFLIITNGLALARAIRAHNIDLIHARSRGPAWAALLASWLTKVPMITTFHGTYSTKGPGKKFYNSSMLRGKHIIANSHFTKQHIIENYGIDAKKITPVPRGFDPLEFDEKNIKETEVDALLSKANIDKTAFKILLPGRVRPWKGHHVALDALAKLKDTNWHLLIVGGWRKDSAYVTQIKEQARKLKIDNKVTFYGSSNNIKLFYRTSDVTLNTSIEPEAFGRTIVESSAMSTPVIASNHGGATETIKNDEAGWLIEPNNADKLAEKLNDVMVMGDVQRKSIGTQAKKAAFAHYTIEKMCMNTFKVYKLMLED